MSNTETKEIFDVVKAEAQIDAHEKSLEVKRENYKAFINTLNHGVSFFLSEALKVDLTKRVLEVRCYNDSIDIYYYYSKTDNRYFKIGIGFAKQYEIEERTYSSNTHWGFKNKLKAGDVCKIDFNSACIDLLKSPISFLEELNEYFTFSKYLTEQLKDTGEFFQMVYKLYEKLNTITNDIDDEQSKWSDLTSERKKYYIDKYKKEFIDEKILGTKDHLILVRYKKTEFYTIKVIDPKIITDKYYTYENHYVKITGDYPYSKKPLGEREYLYHLEISYGRENQKIQPENFLYNLAHHKFEGDEVATMPRAEFEVYKEMIYRENENILKKKSKFFMDKAKNYERIYKESR